MEFMTGQQRFAVTLKMYKLFFCKKIYFIMCQASNGYFLRYKYRLPRGLRFPFEIRNYLNLNNNIMIGCHYDMRYGKEWTKGNGNYEVLTSIRNSNIFWVVGLFLIILIFPETNITEQLQRNLWEYTRIFYN